MMDKKNHQKTSRMHEMKKQSRCKGMFSTYRKSYDAKNRNQLSTSVLFYHSDQNYSKIWRYVSTSTLTTGPTSALASVPTFTLSALASSTSSSSLEKAEPL